MSIIAHLLCFLLIYKIDFTDKGILMTFGSGVSGCLGYGNYEDAPEVCTQPQHKHAES